MSKQTYQYRVLSQIRDKAIPKRLRKMFAGIGVGQVISAKSLLQDCTHKSSDSMALGREIAYAIRAAHDAGLLQRVDCNFVPEWFRSLQTVSYWQSQLRTSRLKNISANSSTSTRDTYLRHLWRFERWLESGEFETSTLEPEPDNRFVRKRQTRKFKNVEELLGMLDQPYSDPRDTVRIVKQYLMDDSHSDKKASYVNLIKCAIASYFEKNEQPIHITFNPKNTYSTEKEIEQSMSVSDVMEFLTTGRPSVTEKALFLCKFHRGPLTHQRLQTGSTMRHGGRWQNGLAQRTTTRGTLAGAPSQSC